MALHPTARFQSYNRTMALEKLNLLPEAAHVFATTPVTELTDWSRSTLKYSAMNDNEE